MPYRNSYNEEIARKMNVINKRYADTHQYSQVVPEGYKSISQSASASGRDGEDGMYGNENPSLVGGASGFSQGTFMDTGFDRVMGAKGSGMKYQKGQLNGSGFWQDFKDGFNMVFEPAAKVLKVASTVLGQPEIAAGLTAIGYGKKKKKEEELRSSKKIGGIVMGDQVGMPFDWNMFKKHAMGGLPLKEFKSNVKGGAYSITGKGFDDFKKKLGKMSIADVKSYVGLGKRKAIGSGMSGGSILGNPDPAVGSGMNLALRAFPEGKNTVERKVGGRLVPTQLLPSSSMSGQGKPKRQASSSLKSRAEVVRKIMKERGISMIEASKAVKAEGLWKK